MNRPSWTGQAEGRGSLSQSSPAIFLVLPHHLLPAGEILPILLDQFRDEHEAVAEFHHLKGALKGARQKDC